MNARAAARALDALARGWDIIVEAPSERLLLRPIETGSAPQGESQRLLISAARAITLKLANQKEAARPDAPVCIAVPGTLDAARAIAIADPSLDLAWPMKGPFAALPLPAPEAAEAAMQLARLAGLLPAYYLLSDADIDADAPRITPGDVAAYADPSALRIAARARLPVSASESAEIVAFRSDADFHEHVALIVGTPDASIPVVRLHSECLTGDVFGSLKCDCGPQLHGALHAMAHAQWGILLYLRQEGRGIGLINKLRAYQLQDQGHDTVDANNRLGFPTDARDFAVAAQMLKALHVSSIRLMTNNPEKQAVLASLGVEIAERLPLQIEANPHNARYLVTKRDRTGHQL
ncbi:GTP cyclohydrolase II [Blastomonas sp. AAP53]|uniref:GTP cyclohydrolase II n=1 Tax=Blastomonas sp. AAP53 TaxID=1248760 RepID=UPI0003078340|nr:GTP cyclohydrolase II [Blastomonas sp. AAP53]